MVRLDLVDTQRYEAPAALPAGVIPTPPQPTPPTFPTVSLTLAYRPPLDWGAMLGYLAARATPGVEVVAAGGDGRYWRSVRLYGHQGYVAVGPSARADALRVEISPALLVVLVPLLSRLRRLFDLEVEPLAVAAHFSTDPLLAPLVARRPGLRVPGAVDGFELALRAVLGQQVSVRGATTIAGRLAALLAEPLPDPPGGAALTHLPVAPERLAEAPVPSLMGIGLTRARAECAVTLARAVAGGDLPELAGDAPAREPAEFVRHFITLPGIGRWTAEYVAMRALGWADAFPEGDLGLRKAVGGLSPARLRRTAERWTPWRAYAAQHLWASLAAPPDDRRRA